ncbi:MAG: hydrogenase formation protein HypD [Proteobacteria bacterium]|nr:hydrogenase formation protein HypD [Pseudomonadota bacterium]
MTFFKEFKDRDLAVHFIEKIKTVSRKKIRLMEVCGTHTVSIFKSGIRSVLPDTISLISGPGCPVCVTSQEEIDAFISLSRLDNVILTTFGDLIRVPGTESSLQEEKAKGVDVRMVYSTSDALLIAKKNPDKHVVFPGVGFETTAPTVAAAILSAARLKVSNFYVYSAHKLVPPALTALMALSSGNIDGFILPGHVSVMIGTDGYRPFFDTFKLPCAITGFEPVDILRAVLAVVTQIEYGKPSLFNAYERAVRIEGNPKAMSLMARVFEKKDALWRGIGKIPESGLAIREEFSAFDAANRFQIILPEKKDHNGCACGEILIGNKTPPECPLFRKACTPLHPFGPCMVSTEGTCSAYYRYHKEPGN